MKISNLAILKTGENDFRNTRMIKIPPTESFHKRLMENEQANIYPYLMDMVQEIEKHGKRLAQSLNINELRYYKKIVSDFLQQALYLASMYEKETVTDRKGKRHIYAMVKKINHKVDILVLQFMNEEKNNIEILKIIDDIRGMLIDLLI